MGIVYIGIDVGVKGGITIIQDDKTPEIYSMPIIKVKKGKKMVTEYDLEGIASLLRPFMDKEVVCTIERVSSMPGEGSVSSFNFGGGFWALRMAAVAFGFKLEIVGPRTWKKPIIHLLTPKEAAEAHDEVVRLRVVIKKETEEISRIKETIKEKGSKSVKNKIEKLNVQIKEAQKEIERLQRRIKTLAKNAARQLATEWFPELADKFKRVCDDGRAESLLVCLYGKDKYHGLVQTSNGNN